MGSSGSSLSPFSNDYALLDGSESQDHYYLLQHKGSKKMYVGRQIHTQDREDALKLQAIIRDKMRNPSPYLTPLVDARWDEEESYCSNTRKFTVLFGEVGKQLATEITRRRALGLRFEIGDVLHVVRRVCRAVQYLYQINSHHGNVSAYAVTWPQSSNAQEVLLVDSWAMPGRHMGVDDDIYGSGAETMVIREAEDLKHVGQLAQEMLKIGEHHQKDQGASELVNYINVLLSERPMERFDVYSMLPDKPGQQPRQSQPQAHTNVVVAQQNKKLQQKPPLAQNPPVVPTYSTTQTQPLIPASIARKPSLGTVELKQAPRFSSIHAASNVMKMKGPAPVATNPSGSKMGPPVVKFNGTSVNQFRADTKPYNPNVLPPPVNVSVYSSNRNSALVDSSSASTSKPNQINISTVPNYGSFGQSAGVFPSSVGLKTYSALGATTSLPSSSAGSDSLFTSPDFFTKLTGKLTDNTKAQPPANNPITAPKSTFLEFTSNTKEPAINHIVSSPVPMQQAQESYNISVTTSSEMKATAQKPAENTHVLPVTVIPELSEHSQAEDDDREYVVEEYENGSRYEGYKLHGMRHGDGKFFYQEGSYYEGKWKQNNMHGFGRLYYPTHKVAYEGDWFMDQFHGHGKVYNDEFSPISGSFDYTDFDTLEEKWKYYEGTLVCDSKEGHGKLVLSNDEYYEGEFQNDKVHGEGKFVSLSGDVITGRWNDSKLVEIL